jgi:hypothetical protein
MVTESKHLITLKANKKRALEAELDEAVLWCNSNKKKARCKATAEQFPNINASQLRRRLDAKSKVINQHEGNQMLTCHEETILVGWLCLCAERNKPKNRIEISDQIVDYLMLRRASNSTSGTLPPSITSFWEGLLGGFFCPICDCGMCMCCTICMCVASWAAFFCREVDLEMGLNTKHEQVGGSADASKTHKNTAHRQVWGGYKV